MMFLDYHWSSHIKHLMFKNDMTLFLTLYEPSTITQLFFQTRKTWNLLCQQHEKKMLIDEITLHFQF